MSSTWPNIYMLTDPMCSYETVAAISTNRTETLVPAKPWCESKVKKQYPDAIASEYKDSHCYAVYEMAASQDSNTSICNLDKRMYLLFHY